MTDSKKVITNCKCRRPSSQWGEHYHDCLLCYINCYCCIVACLFIQLRKMVLSYHRLRLKNLQKELMEISAWPSTTCSIWVFLCRSLNLMISKNVFRTVQRMKIFPPLLLLISKLHYPYLLCGVFWPCTSRKWYWKFEFPFHKSFFRFVWV